MKAKLKALQNIRHALRLDKAEAEDAKGRKWSGLIPKKEVVDIGPAEEVEEEDEEEDE